MEDIALALPFTPATATGRKRGRRPVVLFVLLFALMAAAPFFAPYDPQVIGENPAAYFKSPSLAHPFGTDRSDRDVFSRVLKGTQVSLGIASLAVLITLTLGAAYGTLAALSGGWIDALLMRGIDVALSVPRLLILLAITAFWNSLSLLQLALLLGFSGWFDVARVTRGEVASVLQRDFVLATRAVGTNRLRLAVVHISPHLIPILVVMATLAIGNTIAIEASLMFLGAGIPLSTVSLGTVIHDGVGHPDNWWITIFPGIAIVLIVLACNALGDALRNAFAPTQLHS